MQSFKDWGELQRKSEPQDAKGRAQRSKGEEKKPTGDDYYLAM